jgi:hypothetical protein
MCVLKICETDMITLILTLYSITHIDMSHGIPKNVYNFYVNLNKWKKQKYIIK